MYLLDQERSAEIAGGASMCRYTKMLILTALAVGLSSELVGQGINTVVNPNDWEEINFDFDSSVLVDGFPSMLRIAELLQANPGNKVRVEGYTDRLGNAAYNQALGLARANAVKSFLLKYGARPEQITTTSRGAAAPKVSDQGNTFRQTDEARYMNRRVVLTVTDAQGNTFTPGSAGDAIRAINGQAGPPTVGQQGGAAQGADAAAQLGSCCDLVLKRLDKLDEIASLIKDLADQNAQLRRDVDGLKQNQQALQAAMQNPAGRGAVPAATPAPSATDIASAVRDQLAKDSALGNGRGGVGAGAGNTPGRPLIGGGSILQSLSFNVGADDRRKVTASGRGSVFAPIGSNIGIQAQGEYYYLRGQREGQFDFGMVDRFNRRVQAGLFASFKTVTLAGNQTSGTLGQGSFVLDYFFGRGKVGLFASKAFKDNSLINRANGISETGLVQRNIIEERYLKVVEQIGVASTFALIKNTYAETNIGYLRSSASSNRVGGTLRFVMPVNNHVAFTVEGGVNETYLPLKGTQQGRAAVGVRLGNFMRPKEYLAADHAVPMEIPRVRYELLTRRTRTGNDPPVADAGPSLTNVGAGLVQLDGSKTYDPDGDPITYQWVQEAGPSVSIATPTQARASFISAAGQTYTFRLTAKDNQGGESSSRVQISTGGGERVQILFFQADPRQINGGETATLSWRVLNADSVNISGIGTVPASGTRTVTPTTTSSYILTAKNAVSEDTATTVVVINSARFLTCYASPATITQGQTSTLTWQSNGATGVTISPVIGRVGANGSVAVSPNANTTYTLTTVGGSQADSCTVTVGVKSGAKPSVIHFSASPSTIESGQKTELAWSVIDADSITISGQGGVPQFGTRLVSPTAFTKYVLTATNAAGSVTAEVQVTVYTIPPANIVSFRADKPTITAPGQSVKLTCNTTGAVSVRIGPNAQFFTNNPTLEVFPPADTTYTCIATNSKGQTDTKTVSVKIVP